MKSNEEYVESYEFHEILAKSNVTTVTSTKLASFCPAVSESSIAEFERNGWSRA